MENPIHHFRSSNGTTPTRPKQWFGAGVLAIVLFAGFTLPIFGAEKPNIVVILVDDMGWTALSCQGSTFHETPNIDRLAAQGVRFTDGYSACSVCSPSRAALQTGRYPHRTGVTDYIRDSDSLIKKAKAAQLNPCWAPKDQWEGKKLMCPPNALWLEQKETTIAEMLKPLGYTCGFVGKWHLGPEEWWPLTQGYDINHGGCSFGAPPSYFDPYTPKSNKSGSAPAESGIPSLPSRRPGEYLTDREADEAAGFIRNHKDKPFFLVLAHYAVHGPIQAREDIQKKYELKKNTSSQTNAAYAAMVESVDHATAKVVATLDELGLTEKTLIIFTSDNGGESKFTSNTPLRDGKGTPYEGGIRVPFIVKWPSVARAGVIVDTPVISVDIFATIAGATGAAVPTIGIDGQDLRPLLAGQGEFAPRALYWHFPHYRGKTAPYSIIRDGNWKLIKSYEGTNSLFNLKDDMRETKDLAASMPEKVTEMETKLMNYLTSATDRIPFVKGE